jgi:hypothetical protein
VSRVRRVWVIKFITSEPFLAVAFPLVAVGLSMMVKVIVQTKSLSIEDFAVGMDLMIAAMLAVPLLILQRTTQPAAISGSTANSEITRLVLLLVAAVIWLFIGMTYEKLVGKPYRDRSSAKGWGFFWRVALGAGCPAILGALALFGVFLGVAAASA